MEQLKELFKKWQRQQFLRDDDWVRGYKAAIQTCISDLQELLDRPRCMFYVPATDDSGKQTRVRCQERATVRMEIVDGCACADAEFYCDEHAAQMRVIADAAPSVTIHVDELIVQEAEAV